MLVPRVVPRWLLCKNINTLENKLLDRHLLVSEICLQYIKPNSGKTVHVHDGVAMSKSGWSEEQIKDTIIAYFDLLDSQATNDVSNKAAIYRELSAKHPGRSAKAFELKFQNISAVLYEENLPYCDGLKPRFHYQKLLRLLVLDRIKRNPITFQEPHTILMRKLRELKNRGFIPVRGKGTGRFGLAIENSLGIPQNSDKSPDFMGIELKTKQDRSLQTLFSRVPTRYTGCPDKRTLVEIYGYFDNKRNRQALYTSFNNQEDSLGFRLKGQTERVEIFKEGTSLLEYDAEVLEAALLTKHSQTAYITLTSRRKNGVEECCVDSVLYCKWPSIIRFLRLIKSGSVFLDFTLSISGDRVKDHGFLWKIRSSALGDLYLFNEIQELETV